MKSNLDTTDLTEAQERLKKAGRLHWFHWFIVASSLILTFSAWYFADNQVKQKTEDYFDRQTEQVIDQLVERMGKYEDALWAGVATIHSQSHGIDRAEWKRFADTLSIEKRHPGINGIGIIYNIKPSEVETFLEQQRQERPAFKIYPTHNEKEYFPITYIEPEDMNAKAVGLDMAHEANRYNAVRKARDSGKTQITGPITLVQDSEKTPGFLFHAPFYKVSTQHQNIKDRRQNFVGTVYAPFIAKKLMQGTLDKENRAVGIQIVDEDTILYDEHIPTAKDFDPKPLFKEELSVEMYGRTWGFNIWSTKSFRQQTTSAQPLMILVSGLVIDVLLLTLFFLLARANRHAMDFANHITKSYRRKAKDLEHANAELEEFSYRTSHDLRSPLISSIGLLGVTRAAIKKKEVSKAIESITHAEKSLNTLKDLIEDILTLTKIKNIEEAKESVDFSSMLNNILENLSHMEGFEKLDIQKDIRFNKISSVKKMRLNMIVENLISNAIKYQDLSEKRPYAKITTYKENNDFILSVEDNGLGISKEFHEDLFSMFKRFHPKTSYGSGLGLYMIQKSAHILEGELRFEDNGNGSTFTLSFPLK